MFAALSTMFTANSRPGVEFDAMSNYSVGLSNSFSYSFTATAGSCVLLDIVTNGSTGATAISSVTYGGFPMILADKVDLNNSASSAGTMWRYVRENVPGGSQTVAGTFSDTRWHWVGASAWKNVASAGTTTTTYGSGASLSQGPISLGSGSRIVQSFGQGSNGVVLTAVSGGATRFNQYTNFVGLSVMDATTSTTFTGTASGKTSDVWGGIATVLNAP